MAKIRKRQWRRRNGSVESQWVVSYTNLDGKRQLHTCKSENGAKAFLAAYLAEVSVEQKRRAHAELTRKNADAKPIEVVWGAKAIGEVLNLSERQTWHKLEHGLIPANKVGKNWVATKSKLLESIGVASA